MSCYVQLHRGTGLVSTLIRWQQRGQYAHASILINGTVYESIAKGGVRAVSPTVYEADYMAGRIVAAALVLEPQREVELEAWFISRVGARYDFGAIARFITRTVANNGDRWFCSELVAAGLHAIGVPLFANTVPWEISPGLLARTPMLEFPGWELKPSSLP